MLKCSTLIVHEKRCGSRYDLRALRKPEQNKGPDTQKYVS